LSHHTGGPLARDGPRRSCPNGTGMGDGGRGACPSANCSIATPASVVSRFYPSAPVEVLPHPEADVVSTWSTASPITSTHWQAVLASKAGGDPTAFSRQPRRIQRSVPALRAL